MTALSEPDASAAGVIYDMSPARPWGPGPVHTHVVCCKPVNAAELCPKPYRHFCSSSRAAGASPCLLLQIRQCCRLHPSALLLHAPFCSAADKLTITLSISVTLLQHMLEHDQKLKKFVPLILDSIVYPVVLDANRTVLSLPPIINGAHSAVREAPASQPTCLRGRHCVNAAAAPSCSRGVEPVVSPCCPLQWGRHCQMPAAASELCPLHGGKRHSKVLRRPQGRLPGIQPPPPPPPRYRAARCTAGLPYVVQSPCASALQISLETRDILIEATATDLTKAHVVVSTLCAMFGEYCSTPYEVEPVEVVGPDGQVTGEGGAQESLAPPPQ